MQRKLLNFLIFFIILCNVEDTKGLSGHEVRMVEPGEYSPVACITRYNIWNATSQSMVCSGVIVTQTHILTAEHCFYDVGNDALNVIYGNGDIMNGTAAYPIWYISYDQWIVNGNRTSTTVYNDIGVLKITHIMRQINIAFFSGMDPHNCLNGLKAQVYGCGRISGGELPKRVHTGEVDVFKIRNCIDTLTELEGRHIVLPLNFMCTKANPYVHVDHLDAGGPLTYFGALVAITAGLSPPMNNTWDANKINLHVVIEYYRHFLNSIFND